MKYFILAIWVCICIACSENKVRHAAEAAENQEMTAAVKPADVEGTYILQGENDCGLKIVITRKGDDYAYLLTTTSRSVNGPAILSTEGAETYITFEGIPWDSYEGDISEMENEEERSEPRIPDTISCLFENGTITIQNTGNVMNSYTKLEACGDKYLVLVKA